MLSFSWDRIPAIDAGMAAWRSVWSVVGPDQVSPVRGRQA